MAQVARVPYSTGYPCLLPQQRQLQQTPAPTRGHCARPQTGGFDAIHLGPRVVKPVPPASGRQQLGLRVRGCDGRSFELAVDPEASVQQLKVKVAEKTTIPVQSLILFAGNQPLEDGKILGDFRLKALTELLVVHKVYGG
ncbi:uncharacterized protein LOC144678210 [Cetorhinus maximus]